MINSCLPPREQDPWESKEEATMSLGSKVTSCHFCDILMVTQVSPIHAWKHSQPFPKNRYWPGFFMLNPGCVSPGSWQPMAGPLWLWLTQWEQKLDKAAGQFSEPTLKLENKAQRLSRSPGSQQLLLQSRSGHGQLLMKMWPVVLSLWGQQIFTMSSFETVLEPPGTFRSS